MGDDDDRNGGDGECVIPTLWKVYVWHDAREVVQACCPSRRMMCLYTVLLYRSQQCLERREPI